MDIKGNIHFSTKNTGPQALSTLTFTMTLTPYEQVRLVCKLPRFVHHVLKNLSLAVLAISCIVVSH